MAVRRSFTFPADASSSPSFALLSLVLGRRRCDASPTRCCKQIRPIARLRLAACCSPPHPRISHSNSSSTPPSKCNKHLRQGWYGPVLPACQPAPTSARRSHPLDRAGIVCRRDGWTSHGRSASGSATQQKEPSAAAAAAAAAVAVATGFALLSPPSPASSLHLNLFA